MMPNRTKPHVVAVCGSLGDGSRTRIATDEVLAASVEAGATTERLDLESYSLPLLHGAETPIADAEALRETIAAADSVLLGTPNYHGSYSGALENALDYCGRDEFEGTTVGLLETAAGAFPGLPLVYLRPVSRTLRAWTLPTEVAIPDSHALVDDDGIGDADIARRAQRLGRELVDYAGVSRYPEAPQRHTAVDRGGH